MDSIYNILVFFAEKSANHIFSAKNFSIFAYHSIKILTSLVLNNWALAVNLNAVPQVTISNFFCSKVEYLDVTLDIRVEGKF